MDYDDDRFDHHHQLRVANANVLVNSANHDAAAVNEIYKMKSNTLIRVIIKMENKCH